MATLNVNGRSVETTLEDDTPLLWLVRDQLGLTGTKFGCGATLCRACTVWVDGKPTFSCMLPIAAVGAQPVTTIEGLAGREADAVRRAWRELDVVQCGYCQSGQVMAATALLRDTPSPTDADIDAALDPHLCRCGTYQRIRAAIHRAARLLASA